MDFTSFSDVLRGHPGLLLPFITTKLPAVRSPTFPLLFAMRFNLPFCRVEACGDGQQAFQSSWLADSLGFSSCLQTERRGGKILNSLKATKL